jgi:hypothetical protein
MSSLNGRTVIAVRLHTSSHVVGLGALSSPVTKESGKSLGKLNLTYQDGGVLVELKNIAHYIPGGNIVGMDLAPEPK